MGLSRLGVFRLLALPHARTAAFFIRTHSQRDMGGGGVVVPRPTGLLTGRVLVNGGLAPLRVSTYPFSSLVSRPLGLRISSRTGSSQ